MPAEHIRNQRPLSEPLPPQVPLLEKIYQSRLAHFVDVVYTRPQYREKSILEKTALHVLFPLSWVMLIMALTDAAKDHFRTYGMPEMLIVVDEVWRRSTPYLHRDDLVSKLPIPQVRMFGYRSSLLLIPRAGCHWPLFVLLGHPYRATTAYLCSPMSRVRPLLYHESHCIRI